MPLITPEEPAAVVLASFCRSLVWSELPPPVQARTKELVLDLLGVAVRGSAEPSSRSVAAFARAVCATGGASVIGGGFATDALWATLANGAAAHAVEMDDVTTVSSLHPGTVVIPAALAVAEERGSATPELLTAIVAGYEVMMRVGNALGAASAYRRGFHPTGVAGVFGATAAAGYLLGLSAGQLTHALGIAGTMAAGSLEYLSDGSWTKRLNPGWAAHAGTSAATLAAQGFTGPATVFEGRLGLLRGYSDEPDPQLLVDQLGESFQIMRVSIKPYACCRYNHGLIDCVLALRRAHTIAPSDVETIRLGILRAGAPLVAIPIEQKRAPRNVVDAQFSAPFAAVVALVRGAAGIAEYTQATVDDPLVRSLLLRTDCHQDPTLDALYPHQWPAAVEIRLRDGRTLSARTDYPLGEPENPVSLDGLLAKFTGFVTGFAAIADPQLLAARILNLDAEKNARAIMAILRGS